MKEITVEEWRTVPYEPTEEMLQAARACAAGWINAKGSQLTVNKIKHKTRYQAMLRAAPSPSESVSVEGKREGPSEMRAFIEDQAIREAYEEAEEICYAFAEKEVAREDENTQWASGYTMACNDILRELQSRSRSRSRSTQGK